MSRLFSMKSFGLSILAAALTVAFTPVANAQRPVSTITNGTANNFGIATNIVTNFTYVANYASGSGTTIEQIDNQTNLATAITVTGATGPEYVAVNPVTNKVYLSDYDAGAGTSVSVCNGATDINGTVTNATCTTPITGLPANPFLIAVNPVTNVIYVVGESSGSITAINGNTNGIINTVTGALVANDSYSIAINPVTNFVYVTKSAAGTGAIIVFNGATTTGTNMSLSRTVTAAAAWTLGLSVDPITNEIYAGNCKDACASSAAVKVISYFIGTGAGTTSSSVTTAAGDNLMPVVNPVTNTVYAGADVADDGFYFTGATGATGANAGTSTTVAETSTPYILGENSQTNQTFYTNGATDLYALNSTMGGSVTVTTGAGTTGFALNPITNHVVALGTTAATSTAVNMNSYTAQSGVTTGASSTPVAVAINPASGAIYTANSGSASVSAFTNATPPVAMSGSPITVAATPVAVAVDPVTSSVYVASNGTTPGTLTVIDENSGDPNVTASVTVGNGPAAVGVNPVTNRVYVANKTDGTVSVYNENTAAVMATVTVGTSPYAIAVDPGTDDAYVANAGGTVSVIGAANTVIATLTTGSQTGATNLQAIAVNPITHVAYVANFGSSATAGTITTITGCPLSCVVGTTITVGGSPAAIAIDPATNFIYVANSATGTVSTINGGTNVVKATVTASTTPWSLAVSTRYNEIYVANKGTTSVTVIDGAAEQGNATAVTPTTTVSTGTTPTMIAVNPANNQIYVVAAGSSALDEITVPATSAALISDIATSVAGSTTDTQYVPNDNIYATANPTPTFTVTTNTSAYTNALQTVPITGMYYVIDNPQGNWTALSTPATGAGTSTTTWTVTPTTVLPGVHTLYVYGAYGDENGATTGESDYAGPNNPNIGPVTAYSFVILGTENGGVSPATSTTTTLATSANPGSTSTTITYTATVTAGNGGTIPATDTVTFYDGVTAISGCSAVTVTAGTSATATCGTTYATAGTHYITAVFSGDGTYTWSQSALLTEVITNLIIPTAAMTSPTNTSPVTQPYGGTSAITISGTISWTGAGVPTESDVSFTSTAGTVSALSCPVVASSPITCTATLTPTAGLAIGTYAVVIMFSGDSSFVATSSTNGSASFIISKGTPTIQMTNSSYATPPVATSEAYGATTPFTVYATLSPAGSVAPTAADVVFSTSTAGIGTFGATSCAVVSGVDECHATFTPNGTAAVGSYNINASFSGDANYSAAGPSSNGTGLYMVTIASPTLTLSPSPIAAVVGSVTPITITATATITAGTVNFTGTYATYGTLSATSCTLAAGSCTVSFTPNGTTAAGLYTSILTGTLAATTNNNSATANDNLLIAASGEYTGLALTETPVNYNTATTPGVFTEVLSWINPALQPTGTITLADTNSSDSFGKITLPATSAGITSGTACTTNPTSGTCTYGCAVSTTNLTVTCTITDSSLEGNSATYTQGTTGADNNVTATYSGDTFFGSATGSTELYYIISYSSSGSVGTESSATTLTAGTYGLTQAESASVALTSEGGEDLFQTGTATSGAFFETTGNGAIGTVGPFSILPTGCTATSTSCTITDAFTIPAVVTPGSYTITYIYSGDYEGTAGDTAETTATKAYTENKQLPTVGTVSFSPAATEPYATSQAITISDTLTYLGIGEAPQGAVTFTSASIPGSPFAATCSAAVSTGSGNSKSNVETCTATVSAATIAALPVGSYPVSAAYTTDTNYMAASGTSATFTISKQTPTVAVTSVVPASVVYGSATASTVMATLTYTGSGTAPTGTTLTFTSSAGGGFSGESCTGPTSDVITCTVTFTPTATDAAGGYYIEASYSADTNYAAANSGTATNFTITTATPTLALTPNPVTSPYASVAGITITATATGVAGGTTPGGLVTFTNSYAPYGTLSSTTCTLASGTCSVTFTPNGTTVGTITNAFNATEAANGNYTASATASDNLVITSATATLAMVAGTPGSTGAGITSTTLVATLTPAIAGSTVTFTDVTTAASPYTIGTAMTNASGVATITVNTAGNGSGQSATPSAGKNLFSAAATATADTSAASTTSNTTVYFQGILFSFIGTHNFSGGLTGSSDPYSCCAEVEGTVDGTTAAAYGVSVVNFTSASQTLPVSLTNSASKAFSLSNQCGTTLSSGEVCSLVFDYAPPNGDGCTPVAYPTTPVGNDCTYDGSNYPQGTYESATWTYTLPMGVIAGLGNQGFTTSGVVAASGTLAGKALLTPLSLSVSPTTAAFGSVAQSSTSPTITITVTNSNNSSISYTITPPSSGNFTANSSSCTSPLAANASCNIYLTMVTTNTGTFSDSLTLSPTGGTASTVNITGSVAAASSGITLSSNNHNFGSVTDGTTVAFSVTLTNNTGSAASLGLSNSAGAGYTTSTTCGASLAASASCTYGFTFAPTTPGAATDTLTITSSVPILPGGTGSGPYTGTVTVSGTGVAGGHLTATSATHNWGNITVGTSGGNYGVEITNSTSSAVTLSFSGLTGGSSGFSLVGSSCGTSLAVNANCELVFGFTPVATGLVTGTYPITSSSPLYSGGSQVSPSQITLKGTGQ